MNANEPNWVSLLWFAVFATVACASLVSGQLLAAFGWMSVNIAVFPLILLALALIGWLGLRRRAYRAAS